ncbi:MAG: C25 family cysteine peptidase [bacterium]|nr:C25 family cysteine peptidase [bacterium]
MIFDSDPIKPSTIRFSILLGILIQFFVTISFAIPESRLTRVDEFIGIPAQNSVSINTKVLGVGHLQLQFSHPAIQVDTVFANAQNWTTVSIAGETKLWEVGAPELPVIARTVRLPNTGNVALTIKNADYTEYPNVDIFPQQTLDVTEQSSVLDNTTPVFAIDQAIYERNAFFPEAVAWIGEPAALRDARVAVLSMQPVQYNPVTRTMRVYNTIELEITPIGGISSNEITHDPKPVPSFASFYRDVIGAEDLVTTNETADPGQMLVIYLNNTQVRTALTSFANWKTQSGRKTQIQVLQQYNTTAIQNIINNAFNSYNPPLEYVILAGDGYNNGMVAYTVDGEATDHPYTQIVGTDILADITISRFSYETITHLQTMVNRVINYERNPPMTDTTWFTKGWGYAGISHNVYSNRPAIRFCLEMMNRGGVTNTSYNEHNGLVDPSLINSQLNGGAVLWAHRAAWVGEAQNSDLTSLTNSNKPFVSLNITCGSGDWYGQETGLHETLIRLGTPSNPFGSLATMSTATPNTKPSFNNVVATGVFYAFGVNEVRQPGPMFFAGKYQLWRNFSNSHSDEVDNFSRWNNVMGDCSAQIWTSAPRTLSCTIPQSVGLGTNLISLTVTSGGTAVQDALVTAWKKNTSGATELYVRCRTDENGNVDVPLSIVTTGNLYLSITGMKAGLNLLPIVDTITVSRATADLTVSALTVDDDNTSGTVGNNDQIASPGETIDLSVQLENVGSGTASGISGTFICPDSRVTITSATSTWSNIITGSTGTNATPFRIHLPAGISNGDTIPFYLDVVGSTFSTRLFVRLAIESIAPEFDHYTLSGITELNPGVTASFTVTVINQGLGISSGVSAQLVSLTPHAAVLQPTATYTSLPNGSTRTSPTAQRFQIQIQTSALPGSSLPMQMLFAYGELRDTMDFTMPLVAATTSEPTGPDTYGYYAFENSDSLYSASPDFSWREIIPAYGGNGVRLPMSDGGEYQDTSLAVRLPFPVKYYGNTFDSITVCSNGWLAFGWQPYYNNFRNWHLPANEGPANLVAVFWDDLFFGADPYGVFTYYDAANHQFILTWNVATTFGGSMPNLFQIIISDPRYYPTPTGDAMLKMQYRTVNNIIGDTYEPDYATIGISDGTRLQALELSCDNFYAATAVPMDNGENIDHAILFSTTFPDDLLHLLSPRGGDTLAIGYPVNIMWIGNPSAQTVNLQINRNFPAGTWETILANTANDGSESWTVTTPVTTNARLRVILPSGAQGDSSNSDIVLIQPQPQLHLVTPNGNESWAIGETRVIDWNHAQVPGTISVLLNRNYPTGTWETLFNSALPEYGSIPWIVTQPVSNHARVRIYMNGNTTIGDTSDLDFHIVHPAWLSVTSDSIVRVIPPNDSTVIPVTLHNTGGAPYTGTMTALTGFDGFGYQKTSDPRGPQFSWIDVSSGMNGPTGDDRTGGPYTLPFTFRYFGQSYTRVYMCTNGWLCFDNPQGNATAGNQQLPYTVMPSFLAVLWDNLVCDQGTTKVMMDEVNQRAVFSWENVRRYNQETSTLSFQAILYPDSSFVFQYGSIVTMDTTSTVGIQNEEHSTYYTIYHNVPIPSNHAIRFDLYHRWATPLTTTFSIPAAGSTEFDVIWNTRHHTLHDTVHGTFQFTGTAANAPYLVPVAMIVDVVGLNDVGVSLPTKFEVRKVYPNPFNAIAQIEFALPARGDVEFSLFDALGRAVEHTMLQSLPAGIHHATINANDYAAGVYFVRIRAGSETQLRKLVLVK